MNREQIAQLRAKAGLLYQEGRQWFRRVPVKARVVLVLFLVAALLMAVHTALTAKDASLHLKLQHGFHNAQVLEIDVNHPESAGRTVSRVATAQRRQRHRSASIV